MAILKVATLGNPVLRKQAEPLDDADIRSTDTQRLINDMHETLAEYNGVGLAAPQVHVPKQLCLVMIPRSPRERASETVLTLLNPEIVEASDEMEEDWEGCLSIPDLRGLVPRHSRIRVRAKDRTGRERIYEAEGYTARVMQHEMDHLRGIVFLERMTNFHSLTFREEFQRFWAESSEE